MAEKQVLFPRLNNQNYSTWQLRMEMMLKRDELWFVVSDERPTPVTSAWTTADQKALANIVLFCEDSQLNLIKSVKTAKGAWATLKKFHSKATMTSRVSLLRRICSLNMPEGGNLEKHLFDLEELFDRLECAGQKLETPLQVAMVYRSLPESYSALVTAMESRPDKDQTMEFVKQKLVDEYLRRVERSGESGEKVMKLQSKGRKEKSCYHCGKPGHFRRDCKFLQQDKKKEEDSRSDKKKSARKAKQAVETENPICFMVGSNRCSGAWYVDSGCSSHMSNEKEFFRELNEDVKIDVVLADGSVTSSAGIGEGVVKCIDSDGCVRDITFKEVLYMPNLDSSLLSVRKLTQKGLKVEFGASKCTVLNTDGKVLAEAVLSGNLYELSVAQDARLSKEVRHSESCQHTWHRRFGHREPGVLQRIKAEELSDGFQVTDCGIRQVCEHCLQGKLSRIPFPQMSNNRADRILDLVHTDVCGPMKCVTPGGCRYLMTLIDDYSRYTVVCLLRQKSEAAGCIKRFVAHVKTKFGRAPCVIRSDGGGEYVNQELKEFYASEGIQAQYTAAYSPQQNGVAERKNRSLQEMATCMLLDAGLGKQYWGEAVMTAGYIQNRMPSRSVDKTPFERWVGRKPSLKHFRVFGSAAYVHIPDVKRSKLDAKAQKLLFVGYCEDRKAYRFLDPETNRITISRDARFVELKNGSMMVDQQDGEHGDELGDECVAIDWGMDNTKVQEEQEEQQQSEEESEEEFHGFESEEEVDQIVEGQNQRPVRSTRGVPPEHLRDYVVDVAMAVEQEPVSYEDAIGSSEQTLWKAAMKEEYDSLIQNGTWKLVELPAGREPIGCKWVFKRKEDSVGNVTRFKARLVAQGFSQRPGVDFDAVFAPVASQNTLRVLLTVAGHHRMSVHHIDVKSAYLHGRLQEDIYMQQPKGFVLPGKEKLVCKLERSLYGLKQAAKVWNETINAILNELGFKQSQADPCLYVKTLKSGVRVYLLIYVDDMLLVSTDIDEMKRTEKELAKRMKLSTLGEISFFLGIRVTKDGDGFYNLDQEVYVKKVAKRYGLSEAKGSKVPLDVGYYQGRKDSKNLADNKRYQSLVGALLYVSVNTRPDIAASVAILGRCVSDPLEADWTELKRVVRYLLGTSGYKLKLSTNRAEPIKLIGYCDADWASDSSDRKSNTGYVYQVGHATVCWASRKQANVSLSSMEAEYIALSEACKEVVWLRRLLTEMDAEQREPTVIYEDNTSCISFVEVERQSRLSKHIDTRMHYTKDLVQNGVVILKYCASETMVADILTKPVGSVKQKQFSTSMGLTDEDGRAEGGA